MKWTEETTKKLIELYPNHSNEQIVKILKISIGAIRSKAKKLMLKKDKSLIALLHKKRVEKTKKNIDLKMLIKIAKQYSSRYEFQKNNLLAYRIARRDGVLDAVCSHMVKQTYSSPQLALYCIIKEIIKEEKIIYNDRKAIYPYELDVYVPKYKIAFEYDGLRWHKNNSKDILKNNICDEKKILLIRIKEKNRNYINDIKEQLIENISEINLLDNFDITKNSILNITDEYIKKFISENILNKKRIKEIVKKYDSVSNFRKNEERLYQKLSKTNSLQKYTKNLKRGRIRWTKKLIKEKIQHCEFLKDFIENENACYLHICRNNLKHMLKDLKRLVSPPITYEEIIKNVSENNYKNIQEFRKKNPSMYFKAYKLGILEHLKNIIIHKKTN